MKYDFVEIASANCCSVVLWKASYTPNVRGIWQVQFDVYSDNISYCWRYTNTDSGMSLVTTSLSLRVTSFASHYIYCHYLYIYV